MAIHTKVLPVKANKAVLNVAKKKKLMSMGRPEGVVDVVVVIVDWVERRTLRHVKTD